MNNATPIAARLEVFRHALVGAAEQMGETLARAAFSANIKERRDHSCALFDAGGNLLSQAAHIPVHLGSMPDSVAAVLAAGPLAPGDVALLNDPYAGGTHLPDITLVAPIFSGAECIGYAANRAHHADVGGATAGSMGVARHIDDEGVRLPVTKWFARGVEQPELRTLFLDRVRAPAERLGDLRAQLAAAEVGRRRLAAIFERYGVAEFSRLAAALCDHAERIVRRTIDSIPPGEYAAEDFLCGDGVNDRPIAIRVRVAVRDGTLTADFAGSDPQVAGCVNCPLAVTRSAVAYVVACLAGPHLPHNAGMFRPIRVIAPPGCVVHAVEPAAVAAGNVETSQRIVDVVMGALARALPGAIPAGSAGTMASLSFAGIEPRTGQTWSYYETIAGGAGASPQLAGASAVHTHMTNTWNTPVEALESAFPLRVLQYAIRAGSGGHGASRGGDGVIRAFEALAPMKAALLADREQAGGAGADGGKSGAAYRATLQSGPKATQLAGKCNVTLEAGDRLTIQTPGGGGYGPSAG